MNKSGHKGRTIRKDLVGLLLLATILPSILITTLFAGNVKKIIDTDVRAYQEVIIDQTRNSLENIFTSVNIIHRSVIGKIVPNYLPLEFEERLKKEEVIALKDLLSFLHTIAQAYTYINGIYLIYDSDYIISSRLSIRTNVLLDKSWVIISRASDGEEYIIGPHFAEYNVGLPQEEYDTVISSIQKFYMPGNSNNEILIQVDINLSVFQDFIESMDYNEQIPMYIYNSRMESSLLKNDIFNSMNEKQITASEQIKREIKPDHLYLHALPRKDHILEKFRSAILGMILIISIISFFIFLTALLLSRRITSPLHDLYTYMKQVGQGDFSPIYPRTNYLELGYLIERFRKMVSDIDNLIETVVSKEKETTEARLQALQAKINPHFLYNTLDVIRSIALEHDNMDINEMTLSLSRLFRYNVGNLEDTTTLKNEIEYIYDYLKIQNYRFGDRITVKFSIEEEANKVQITRFVLQPIIENSFKHGLELRGKGGLLKISAGIVEDTLEIRIFDNGPGIKPQKLLRIQDSLIIDAQKNKVKNTHGLNNVNLRLKLLYGNEYGIYLTSEYLKWTEVRVTIPFNPELQNV